MSNTTASKKADVVGLKLIAIATRRLATYTALGAVLFFVLSGFLVILETLPRFHSLGIIPLALADVGILFAGVFLGFTIVHQLAKNLYLANRPAKTSPEPLQPVAS